MSHSIRKHSPPICALCQVTACRYPADTKQLPGFCAMPNQAALLERIAQRAVEDGALHEMALASARTEATGYMRWTRAEEIMDFARRIGAAKLGIAHCVGLMNEARLALNIFEAGGFTVHTVCCKVGSVPKERLGLSEEDKVHPGEYEAACNPVAQAALLDEAGSQLNIVIGLCVGHDSAFFMHSKAPTTVLVVKDRVLGHNPVAALYTSGSYYKRLTQAG